MYKNQYSDPSINVALTNRRLAKSWTNQPKTLSLPHGVMPIGAVAEESPDSFAISSAAGTQAVATQRLTPLEYAWSAPNPGRGRSDELEAMTKASSSMAEAARSASNSGTTPLWCDGMGDRDMIVRAARRVKCAGEVIGEGGAAV